MGKRHTEVVVRRSLTAAAALAALALTVPQGASAQAGCQVPKAWQTAALEFEYDVERELVLLDQHTRDLRSAPSSALPSALATFTGQRVVMTGYLASSLARFGGTVLSTPPDCGGRRR